MRWISRWYRSRKPPQTGWSANAYLTDARLVIHSCSRTHNHRGWYNQPVFGVSADAEPAFIGNRLLAALNASVWDSRIDDSQLSPHPILVAAGCRSWNDLERLSKLVNVDSDRRSIRLIPCRAATRREGRGYSGIPEQAIAIPWESAESVIGSALLSAFAVASRRSH